jgi:hypothetical protein
MVSAATFIIPVCVVGIFMKVRNSLSSFKAIPEEHFPEVGCLRKNGKIKNYCTGFTNEQEGLYPPRTQRRQSESTERASYRFLVNRPSTEEWRLLACYTMQLL